MEAIQRAPVEDRAPSRLRVEPTALFDLDTLPGRPDIGVTDLECVMSSGWFAQAGGDETL